MMPLATPLSSSVATTKREHEPCAEDLSRPFKRRCSTFQTDILKSHARISQALAAVPNVEAPSASFSVAKHWQKKSAADRRDALGKAHSTAHRYLEERGVWEGVAQILDRHFTMSAVSPPTQSVVDTETSVEQTEAPISSRDVDHIVDDVVSGLADSHSEKTPVKPLSLPDITAIPKTATETADALAQALSSPDVVPISSVPNPLLTSVPNPLAAFQTTSFPDMTPIKAPSSSSQKAAARVSTCSLDVPMEVFSHQNKDEEDAVVPVSPLSNGGFQSTPPVTPSVPVWSLNEVTFFADENAMEDDEWALDPLVLLA
uniref:Uncharacterized protein n=1 Tax=Amphora coffeiformis TaxID=265554 RepID=A0A7S3L8R0_9STRA